MADRTVKVKLTADISDYTAALAKAAGMTRQLGGDVERGIDRDVTPVMKRAGEKQGGVLAQGARAGLVRNSPLIAAGVSAALAAGAPAVLAGATVLFAGVGAIAAAQTEGVQQAWSELGREIRAGAIVDAGALVPVYERMAQQIGEAFQRMRPEIQDAFEASAPLVDNFTDSVLAAAENALPGLVRAVEQGGPVIEGLGNLMEDVGTGVANFLDAMSDNSGAAGDALTALGDILGAALPLLGELLGTGSELAAAVLPGLAAALGTLADLASALAPVLAPIVAGITGLKIAQSVAPGVANLGNFLVGLSASGGRGSAALSKVGFALRGMSAALPGVGLAVGVVTQMMSDGDQQIDSWARAMLDGGSAASTATKEIAASAAEIQDLAGGWSGLAADFTLAGAGIELAGEKTSEIMDNVRQRAKDLYTAMSPLDKAQQDVTRSTNDLEQAVGRYGVSSTEARTAALQLEGAQAVLEGRQSAVALATDGSRDAMDRFAEQLGGTRDAADEAAHAVDDFKLSLDLLTGAQVSMIEVEAALHEAMAQADGALEGLSGHVLDAAGNFNLQSEAGRTAAGILIDVKDKGNLLIATMIEQGATAEQVQAKDAQLREGFIRTAQQMGISRAAAENLADQILGIPSERNTKITADTAAAAAQLGTVKSILDSIPLFHNTTVTTTYVTRGVAPTLSGAASYDFARGGLVHAYAGGGFEPMRGGIAQIVPPNAIRVIGDRVRDDEAYIPINNDARSHDILRATAERMGYGIGREFSGSGGGVATYDQRRSRTVNVEVTNVGAPMNERDLLERIRDQEWLAGG